MTTARCDLALNDSQARDEDLDVRPYYDFSGGVRGKYVGRFAGSCKVVELEPHVAEAFLDAASVNRTLREVIAARGAKSGVSEKIEGMTLDEELNWLASQELEDPFLKRLRDRAARQSSPASRATRGL